MGRSCAMQQAYFGITGWVAVVYCSMACAFVVFHVWCGVGDDTVYQSYLNMCLSLQCMG